MAISKITVHGVADTAGELEQTFRRLERQITSFIADKTPDFGPWQPARDADGNILYTITDLKFVPKINQIARDENGQDELGDWVVGHATFTIWHG